MVILIEMYEPLPILWTFKTALKIYSFQTKHSNKQSVQQVQATADDQSVLIGPPSQNFLGKS